MILVYAPAILVLIFILLQIIPSIREIIYFDKIEERLRNPILPIIIIILLLIPEIIRGGSVVEPYPSYYKLLKPVVLLGLLLCQILPSWRGRIYVDTARSVLKTPYIVIILALSLLVMQSHIILRTHTSFKGAHTLYAMISPEQIPGTWAYTIQSPHEYFLLTPH